VPGGRIRARRAYTRATDTLRIHRLEGTAEGTAEVSTTVRSARFPLVELTIDGTIRLATGALLLVTQDEPARGVLRPVGWQLSAQLGSHLPEGPECVVVGRTADGRVFRGQAIVTNESMSSSHRGTTWRLELTGTGPLEGLDPDLDLV
jgi:hypothetical protein